MRRFLRGTCPEPVEWSRNDEGVGRNDESGLVEMMREMGYNNEKVLCS